MISDKIWRNVTSDYKYLHYPNLDLFKLKKKPNIKQGQLYNWLRWDKIVFCNSDVSIRTNMRITGQLLGPLRQISAKIHLVCIFGCNSKKKIQNRFSLIIVLFGSTIFYASYVFCFFYNRSFSFIYLSSKLNIKKNITLYLKQVLF